MEEIIKRFTALANDCEALKTNAGRKAAIKARSAIEILETESPKAETPAKPEKPAK